MELCSLPAIYLMTNYGGGNEDNGDLLQKIPCMYCYTHCPQPWIRSPLTHASTAVSWTLLGNLGQSPVGSLLISPGSLCTKFCLYPPRVYFPVLCKSGSSIVGLKATSSKRFYAIHTHTKSPCPCNQYLHRKCWNSSVSVSVGSLGPGAHKVFLSPLSISDLNGVWF